MDTSTLTNLLIFFMSFFFMQHIFDPNYTYLKLAEEKIQDKLLKSIDFYFYTSDYENDNKNTEEKEPKEEEDQLSKPKIYEDKYLEEVKKLPYEIIFTDDELAVELDQRIIIKQKMEDTLEANKLEVETRLANLSQKYTDVDDHFENNTDITENDVEEDADYSKISNTTKQELLENIKKEIEIYTHARTQLSVKTIEDSEVNKAAREFILKERLDKLKNCIIMEKTPLGNVVMFYNNSRSSFEYYSDSTIPYRYLEVVGRKYILTYKCKQIYVDMSQEIKEAEQKLDQKKQELEQKKQELEQKKQELEQKKQDKEIPTPSLPPKKNIFAKFKNYNKDTSIQSAAVPLDRPQAAKQTKPQEDIIVKERANRYSFEGKLANFNFLKKVDRKVVDKRYAMSFSEFKKMQKTQ